MTEPHISGTDLPAESRKNVANTDSGDHPADPQNPDSTPLANPINRDAAFDPGSTCLEQPVIAELVDETTPRPPVKNRLFIALPLDMDRELQITAAIGGAVGALVLGAWSIFSALISPYGAINSIIAIMMGIYGLKSHRKRLAILGMGLAIVGLGLGVMEVNGIVSKLFQVESTPDL